MAEVTTARLAAAFVDYGGQVWNIKHPRFGAVGDGVTDDTEAVQAALDAAGTAPVVIPTGTFLVDRLVLNDGQVLWLLGTLQAGDALATSVIRAASRTGVRILGLGGRIVGNAEDALSAVVLSSCTDALVSGLRITGCNNKGVSVEGTSTHVRAIGNYVSGANGTTGAGLSIFSTTAEHCVVEANTVESCRIGITANGGAYHAFVGNVVRDCSLMGLTFDGVISDTGDGTKHSVMSGNISEGHQSATYGGIYIGNGASFNTITGNICRSNTGSGIFATGSSGNAPSNLVIVGNVCADNALDGISLSRADFSVVSGNNCYNNGDRGIQAFIAEGLVITGNRCKDNTNDGIILQAEDCLVVANQCKGNTHGIRSAAGGSSDADNWIANNDVRGNTTSAITKRSTDVARDNQGHVTEANGTATLSNGSTTAVVTHGLGVTPALKDIHCQPIEAWGAMTSFYPSNPTSTQFTINADQDPGQDVDFAWSAVIR